MTYEITLTWYEQQMAAFIGIMRGADSVRRGKRVTLISGENNEENEINSTGAELAVAKLINQYWCAGIAMPDLCDVGRKIEVRQTWRPDGRLLIRWKDEDDRPFVLVHGVMPTFEIVGWMYGADAKRPEWLCYPGTDAECWMVPVNRLKSMYELVNRWQSLTCGECK